MSSPQQVNNVLEHILREYYWVSESDIQEYDNDYGIPNASYSNALDGIMLAYESRLNSEHKQSRLFYAVAEVLQNHWPVYLDDVESELYDRGDEWGIYKKVARNFGGFRPDSGLWIINL